MRYVLPVPLIGRTWRYLCKPMRGKTGTPGLLLILCFSTLLCFGTPRRPQPQQPESRLERGLKLLSQGRLPEAVGFFNQCKQTNPQDAQLYFYVSMALAEAGRLSAAALELDEAIRLGLLEPQRPEYLVFQANLFARLKQRVHVEETLATLQKQGATERLEASWLWMLSDVYYRLERPGDALHTLDLLAKRDPDDPRLNLNRSQAYVLQNQFDLALEALRKSLVKHPGNPLVYFELGKLLHQRSDLPAAKDAFLAAVRLEQNNPLYLQKLGTVCLAAKEVDEALIHLERAVRLEASSAQIYYALGQAYTRKGAHEKAAAARQKFQTLKQQEDQQEEVERMLARSERLLDEGKEAEARTTFEQIVATAPQNWTAHGYLAEMFLTAGDSEKAWSHLVRMEAIDPESVVGNYLLAQYWVERKEFESARVYAEKVKQARPAHAALRNLLGQIYLGLGQRTQAISEFEAAVRLAPERADFRANLSKLKNQ